MKIAIHKRQGSYSDQWIEYCKFHQIDFKIVNCFDNDIIKQLDDCDALMWHWPFWDYQAIQFARQLTQALEQTGILVYPDIETSWHYDDKIGQKYLLEAIKAPLVPTMVFYDKNEALEWCQKSTFPKVFKLRGGASSVNVKLVRNKSHAIRLINTAFGKGFSTVNRVALFKDRILAFRKNKNSNSLIGVIKGIARLFVPTDFERNRSREKGVIYFQDFIPENQFDTRVYVMGDHAFGLKRYVRKNDFRASGSGLNIFDREQINTECVKIAFDLTQKLLSQSIAFDFIYKDNQPMLVEISYASVQKVYLNCPGYWDRQLKWHEGTFRIEHIIIANLIKQFENKQKTILQPKILPQLTVNMISAS